TRSLNPPSQAAGVLPGDRLPAASTRKALERPSATSTIEMIRSRFSPAGASCLGGGYPIRATVLRQDLVELELPELVDAVFSNATFHWIHDHDALFAAL